MAISEFEKSILETPSVDGEDIAVVVWVARDGQLEFGRCRWRSDKGDHGVFYSVSPFPGAWTEITESQIVRVRHPRAMR